MPKPRGPGDPQFRKRGAVGGARPVSMSAGCTDSRAVNYQSPAVVDDDSCLIPGCMDTDGDEDVDDDDRARTQFNPTATYHDGSCPTIFRGCTDSAASNFRLIANEDDRSCRYTGCMDQEMFNFDSQATEPGVCKTRIRGCTDPRAPNFHRGANTEDASCIWIGCTDSRHPSYDPTATINDGLCMVQSGCTNPQAANYHPSFNYDDGSCRFFGCTDPTSSNYSPTANMDDGTCQKPILVMPSPSPLLPPPFAPKPRSPPSSPELSPPHLFSPAPPSTPLQSQAHALETASGSSLVLAFAAPIVGAFLILLFASLALKLYAARFKRIRAMLRRQRTVPHALGTSALHDIPSSQTSLDWELAAVAAEPLRSIVLGGISPVELTQQERATIERKVHGQQVHARLQRHAHMTGQVGHQADDARERNGKRPTGAEEREDWHGAYPREMGSSSDCTALLLDHQLGSGPNSQPASRRSASFATKSLRPLALNRRRSVSLSTAIMRCRTHVQPTAPVAALQPIVLQLPVQQSGQWIDIEAPAGRYQPPVRTSTTLEEVAAPL